MYTVASQLIDERPTLAELSPVVLTGGGVGETVGFGELVRSGANEKKIRGDYRVLTRRVQVFWFFHFVFIFIFFKGLRNAFGFRFGLTTRVP